MNENTESMVYLASDIQKVLGLGRTKTYEFLNDVYKQKNPPFRVIKVGTSIRVLKTSFDAWLNDTVS
ncbi:MAG: helix-turn-helix domain-containing protein [Clostridiales bacterium]|nr:helix-turn-helix domain-containing protein [Clostridiales bacterium]